MYEQQNNNPYVIPFSIIIAGVLIAGAIMYAGDGGSLGQLAQVGGAVPDTGNANGNGVAAAGQIQVKPVSGDDRILGDPSAPVKIVEFSDLECPFCAQFHTTMRQIAEEYGKSGKIAWVYRHFPLESIHSSARLAAHGTECARELGGPAKFWDFANMVFERQREGLGSPLFLRVASTIGLDSAAFSSCLQSGKYNDLIDQHVKDAFSAGAQGTPYSVLIAADGSTTVINGAEPYASVKQKIEQALGK